MKTGRLIFAASAIALAAVATSCEHKELCYDHAHFRTVNVIFD